MFRALASRKMLGGLALVLVFAAVCVLLGRWQWGRYEDRQVKALAVSTNYDAAPVPLASVVGRLPLAESDEWLRVTTTGRYATGQQLLVRNRALDGQGGLEVLAPLDLQGDLAGQRVFVDRGWVANPDAAAERPAVPAVPAGDVTVEGWLRPGEPDLGRDLPAGQLASIDLAAASAQTGGGGARDAYLDAYLVLGSEQTSRGTPARPSPLAPPDISLGPHQAYAIQWWLTSIFGFVLLGYRLRVAAAEEKEVDRETVPAARKPKRVRIWDEEDG